MPAWHLSLVSSGGQTGVDQAGICAAKFLNYQTGGRAPKGWLTEKGAEPWLKEFGLVENAVESLRSRTYHNVTHADATVIITGEVLTWEDTSRKARVGRTAIYAARMEQLKRAATADAVASAYAIPEGSESRYTLDLAVAHGKPVIINPTTADQLREFIYQTQAKTLNIAGTRESRAPGIYRWAYDFFLEGLVPF